MLLESNGAFRDVVIHTTAFYQLGVVLGGIFFTALFTELVDSFVDVVQTRVLAIAKDEKREPDGDDIASLARTVIVKNAFVLVGAGGLCLSIELHRWDNFVSPIVLLALFSRNLYMLFDATLCFRTRARLPRGLPRSVMPDYEP